MTSTNQPLIPTPVRTPHHLPFAWQQDPRRSTTLPPSRAPGLILWFLTPLKGPMTIPFNPNPQNPSLQTQVFTVCTFHVGLSVLLESTFRFIYYQVSHGKLPVGASPTSNKVGSLPHFFPLLIPIEDMISTTPIEWFHLNPPSLLCPDSGGWK